MKTLQIEIPEGYEIKSVNYKTGQVCFQQKKPIIERIKTMDDVFLELKIDPDKFYDEGKYLATDEFAYRQLKVIAKALNEEMESNFNDQYKYYPYFETKPIFKYKGTAYAYSSICFNKDLYFKKEKLAEYAGKQFIEFYKAFIGIKNK